jgi:uncharacterized protein (DUF983 family)
VVIGYLSTVLQNKCPRCRKGHLFVTQNPYDLKNNMKMNERCPVCSQRTELEVGFYYGTSYVSYAIGVLLSGVTFALWWVFIGFSLREDDYNIYYWLATNAVLLILLQPVFMRISRTMWLSWFLKYDPHWKEHNAEEPERIVEEHMKNW